MVEKLWQPAHAAMFSFESSVNSYGRKTQRRWNVQLQPFESSVNSYGRKTKAIYFQIPRLFESSVNSYGRKTEIYQS